MAKNYNSSENCHNEADKHTSNRNASRITSNKIVYGKNASDRIMTASAISAMQSPITPRMTRLNGHIPQNE